ncbi:MAG: hypothetical protein TU35_002375 [Thermoproteus sp. AZ2]|jgi:hypothetical protein|uniref:Uncharacterized protein n=1 Tax=Thermoproteus sp. AZ2 TaxID=1609232 RepID=A0ACC6UZH1_9CREN
MILGFGGQVWLYFARLDLPAVLTRLAGLGYGVASAYYMGQELRVERLGGEGEVAQKGFEDGVVKIYFNEERTALGVASASPALLRQGLAEAYRALAESGAPQPQLVEAYLSFSANIAFRGRSVTALGLELAEEGAFFVGGREGLEVRISVAPIHGDRRLVTVYLGGRWDAVVPIINNAQQAIQEVLSALT